MAEKKKKFVREKREKTEVTVLVGSRLKSIRVKRKMSQAAIAEASGISSKYLGEVERGEANISIELINRIAVALNASMSAILENEHERPHQELISEIVTLAPRLNEKDARIAYRMIKMLVEWLFLAAIAAKVTA